MRPARDHASYFAAAARGTEDVLAAELSGLGIASVEPTRGGVAFGGALADAYRACLWSRVASRVLLPLARFEAGSAQALYDGVRAIDWTTHLGPERTLAVDTAGGRSPAGPRNFVALKTKDAIVDRVRAAVGARPDVDTERPDVRIHVHLDGPWTTVSLDLSGRGLHRRGLGRERAVAPLKENLAAALLRIAGWPPAEPELPLLDPMCGSGTLLVEAAAMALDVAPGLGRGRIGAEGWRGHDASIWERLCAEARERRAAAAGRSPRIAGSDAAAAAVRAARSALVRAGLRDAVRVERGELRDAAPPWSAAGIVITNPPYGERLGETGELGPLYELLGDVLKRRFPGWRAFVLCGNRALEKRIGLRAASRRTLFNGPIECRFLELPLAATPAAGTTGPGWRKPGREAGSFALRLGKNLRRLGPWAAREGLDCYRLYDSEVPEYNLAVDRYGGAVRVEERPRPRSVAAADAERHLRDALLVVQKLLQVDAAEIILRVAPRRASRPARAREGRERWREVHEGDLRFLVDPERATDTGLALDERLLRRLVRERAAGRDLLDLDAGTCAAAVAAAAGRARTTTSVTPTHEELDWGRRNLALNGFGEPAHRVVRGSAASFRPADRGRRWGVILAGARGPAVLETALRWLAPDGEIVLRGRGPIDAVRGAEALGLEVREVTGELVPEDFAERPRLRAWLVRRLVTNPSPR